MKIYKMIGLTLVGVMLFNTPVMAESKESLDIASNEYENVEVQQVQEKESQKNSLENVKVDEQSPIYMDKDEVKEIYPNIEKISTYSTEPDDCEPNDTIVTAYPYSKVPVVTSKVTSKNDFYSLGMKHAGLHSKEDEDWFYTELQSGQEYFVDLRNVGKTNWFISLYYFNEDGTGYYYTTDPSQKSVYEKKPEKYFYFTAEDTGKYYIRICNGNDWDDNMHYFFYVGPSIQYFDIVDFKTYGGTQLYANGYQTYGLDLIGGGTPEITAIVNMSIKDTFPDGKKCLEVEKYMSAGGKTYYSAAGGDSDVIQNIKGASLGQLWTIGGRCAKGTHFTYWSAELNGRFGCVMAPYPGNELSF